MSDEQAVWFYFHVLSQAGPSDHVPIPRRLTRCSTLPSHFSGSMKAERFDSAKIFLAWGPDRRSWYLLKKLARIPGFLEEVVKIPRRRVMRSYHSDLSRKFGFWEKHVMGKWRQTSAKIAQKTLSAIRGREYLDRKYVETYRLVGGTFAWLLTLCTQDLEYVSTRLRELIPPPKQLAILLHWLAHGFAERQLANLYHVGPSTVNSIIHTTLAVLLRDLVPLAIRFPQGDALRKTMQDF